VALAHCSNPNRLFDVDCSVSEEVSIEYSVEKTYEFSKSWDLSWNIGGEVEGNLGVSAGVQGSIALGVEGGLVSSWGEDHSWTGTSANSTSTTMTCEGAMSVPPLHSMDYSVVRSYSTIIYTTISDIRLTKCEAAYPVGIDEEDLYLYEYGVVGDVTVKSGDSCLVSFSTAKYEAAAIACSEFAAMSYDGFPTYTPICDRADPLKWEPCQCSGGDTRTYATCVCVDEVTGNPWMEPEKFGIAVVDPYGAKEDEPGTGYAHWSGWCEDHCANSYYPGIPDDTNSAITDAAASHSMANQQSATATATATDAAVVSTVSDSDRQLVRLLVVMALIAFFFVALACLAAAIYLFRKICAEKAGPELAANPKAAAEVEDVGATKVAAPRSGGGLSEMEMSSTLAIARDDDGGQF